MTPKKTQTEAEKELSKETAGLAKEVTRLTKEVQKLKGLEFVKILNHPWKFMGFSLLKGLMVGFGSVLGASVLVGIAIYLLAQISFVPIIGDLIEDIMGQVEVAMPSGGENGGETSVVDQFNEAKENIESKESSIPARSTPSTQAADIYPSDT